MRKVTDAEFQLVEARLQVPWTRILGHVVFSGWLAWCAWVMNDHIVTTACIFMATMQWPFRTWMNQLIAPSVSQEEADLLAGRISARRALVGSSRTPPRA